MRGIAIYLEGGGTGQSTRAALRQGMDEFLRPLKQAARAKALHWRLVCCGSRRETFRKFEYSASNGEDMVVLLVDAEGPVVDRPREHLRSRDGWDLNFASSDRVHLMVQTMEAWIVSDSDALSRYYGQGFNRTALPRTENLESVSKRDVERSLRQATEHTQKGRYKKIRHARDLLGMINAEETKRRCRHCARLFHVLGRLIEETG